MSMLDQIAGAMTRSHYGLRVSWASERRLLVSRHGGRILFACEAQEESHSAIVRVGHYRKGHELDLVVASEPGGSRYLIDGESVAARDLAKVIVERAVRVLKFWPPE